MAELEIVEVHNHSLPTNYVKPCFDARVNMGSADLKIRNNSKIDYLITCSTIGDKCRICIYGKPCEYKVKTRFEKYQDIEAMNSNIAGIKNVMMIISFAFLLIVVSLMAIVYVNSVINRRYEFAILKANGLRRGEINKLLLLENGKMVIWSTVLASCLSYIFGKLANALIGEGVIIITYSIVVKIIIISILTISIPTLLGVAKIGKYSTEKLMRN